MAAIGAVDMALWDIKGKALNTPLYNLLGGASREGCMVYTHANGKDISETIDAVQKEMATGYVAVRAQAGVPGVASSYGVPKGTSSYEPAERGLPSEGLWSTERYLNFVPKLFEQLRQHVGEDVHLLHDVHHRLTPIEAARLGKSLEPYHLFWMEDPTPAELQSGFASIRQHTTTPIAVGEVFNTLWDCKELIERQLIDYIRITVVHGGGISHLRKIADFADIYQVRTGCHGATDMSPITMAAALHLGLAIHNFGIQEHMRHTTLTDEVFPHAYRFDAGYMHPGNAPGLGVEIDEALAAKYPYQRAYLPIARKLDGTLTDW
jgi:mannonate dehydratase